MECVNSSIVLYQPDWKQVEQLLATLLQSEVIRTVYLIDNSPEKAAVVPISSEKIRYIYVGKNVGYGAGHNIAIRETIQQNIPYHLVVNADVQFEAPVLTELLAYMQAHPEVGHMMPRVEYPDGRLQYVCKLIPTPADLMVRRFLPNSWMRKSRERFELRQSGYDQIMNIPYLSGCFMFLRTEALLKVGLFDGRFFMYPEDIDLTRRIHRHFQTLYYPKVTIRHEHEQASYHDPYMLWIHIVNICRYFNKWGWFRDPERRQVNEATLRSIDKLNSQRKPTAE